MVAAAPAGVGTIDGFWTGLSVVDNMQAYVEGVRARTTVINPGLEIATTRTDNGVSSLLGRWTAQPNTQFHNLGFNLNDMLVAYIADPDGSTPFGQYPTHNAIRFGLVCYNPVIPMRITLDARFSFDDD